MRAIPDVTCPEKQYKPVQAGIGSLSWALSSPLALSLTWRAATQPLFIHRISVVRVYLSIASITQDPAHRDSRHLRAAF